MTTFMDSPQFFYTSESVTEGHPDKLCDQISDAVLDALIAQDPQSKIGVKLHSGLLKLTKRGWLGVMMSGGAKVFGWMAAKGLKGPSAIAHALGRLRKG